MTMKMRIGKGWIGMAVLLGLAGRDAAAAASAGSSYTMMVVPSRYSVVQVAMDLLKHRDAVLVTYQGDATTDNPLLYAWNGREWVYVSMDDYRSAAFVQRQPSQVALVGDEALLPPALIEGAAWCPKVMTVPGLDTPTLVNSFGKLFKFRKGEWDWFARRYNMTLMDQNAERREQSWYDRPHPDLQNPAPRGLRESGLPMPRTRLGGAVIPDAIAPAEVETPGAGPAPVMPPADVPGNRDDL
jgi:hypothetical protein